MEMTLHQLRLLREVSRTGTIAAAAASLGYTPSAVSQQLSGLEKATGVAVLERIGRNVRLTDAGRELVRHADDLLPRMEAAQVAIEQVSNEVRGTLEVAVYESVASTLLAPLLQLLAQRHPELKIRTRQMDPDVSIDLVEHGDLDLAFAIDYSHAGVAPRQGIDRVSLIDDRFHVIVSAADDVVGPTVSLLDVADRPFICSPPDLSCGRCVVAACGDSGFVPDIAHQLDDYPTALHLVAAGQGIAMVPDLGLVHVPAGIRVLELEPALYRVIQLAYRTSSAERPALVAFREACLEVAAGMALCLTAA